MQLKLFEKPNTKLHNLALRINVYSGDRWLLFTARFISMMVI